MDAELGAIFRRAFVELDDIAVVYGDDGPTFAAVEAAAPLGVPRSVNRISMERSC